MIMTKGERIVLMLLLMAVGGIIALVALIMPGDQSPLALLGGLLIGSGIGLTLLG